MWIRLVGAFLCLFACVGIQADVWVGYPAPDFTVHDVNGNEISLQKYVGKIVVLEWQDVENSFTKKFYSRLYYEGKGYMQTLEQKFTAPPNNVIWLTIDVSSNPMTAQKWNEWLTQEGAVPTAVIVDSDKTLTKMYGVSKVPEVFVVNADGMVAYKGSIDSIRSSDPTDITRPANRRYLEAAIQQLLEGKSVFTPDTIPYGLSVRY